MSVRVHELAKKLKLTSKDLIRELTRLQVPVKGHMSVLDEKVIRRVEEALRATPSKPQKGKAPQKKRAVSVKAASKPKQAPVKSKPQKTSPTPVPAPPVQQKKQEAPKQEAPVVQAPARETRRTSGPLRKIKVELPVTVAALASKIGMGVGELIKRFMKVGVWLNVNQLVEAEMLERVSGELECAFQIQEGEHESLLEQKAEDRPEDRTSRPPVITLMGHVDHGKTSLLDAIRKSRVAEREAGSITQHIGAYSVSLPKGKVTFLDTPGHEAFTAMRARGAVVTDIVVLLVAANDGIKPQTLEAIDHARAAKVPIVVAINKVDIPGVDLNRVKKQLAEVDLMSEDWGGKTITVGVSAKTGKGIDELLEMLLLESELLEMKANKNVPASGVVVEGRLSKGRGPVATVLVRSGTLRAGDVLVSGLHYGRIRAMLDDQGVRTKKAGPSDPVEIWGLSGVPEAGEDFVVVPDERRARELSMARQDKSRLRGLRQQGARISLQHLYDTIKEGRIKDLNIVLKADVQGSIEAIQHALEKLPSKDVKATIIHSGVGGINESDINLALASNALVIGFHVKPTPQAQEIAEKEDVEILLYDVIYSLVNDIRSSMEGMLEPTEKQISLGYCKVLRTFKVSRVGTIAGCQVQKGVVTRSSKIHLIRNNVIVYPGTIHSLKRFKDDVKEVSEGMECGVVLTDYHDIKVGDVIEAYKIEKTAAKL